MIATESTTARGTWRPMLASTLYRNLKVVEERQPDGRTRHLKIPVRRPDYLVPPISWVVRPPDHRTLVLDPVGTDLWDWCDGRRTVEEVIELFARKHNLTFHEGRVSATAYLKELVKRGALAVAI